MTKIVELYEPFSILYKHLEEQERAQNQVTSSLRQACRGSIVSNRVIDFSQTSPEFIAMIDERNNHRRKCKNNRNDSIIDLISSPVKREHKRLKGVRNSFFLNEDGQLELVDKEVSSISTSSNCYNKEIVTIDSSASSSSCLSLSECVTTRDKEIDKAAQSMHLRLISKGRREMTNIIKACLDDNSNENTLKKKQLKKQLMQLIIQKETEHMLVISNVSLTMVVN